MNTLHSLLPPLAMTPDAVLQWLLAQIRTMSGWEWAGALTGFACVYLTIKNRISNWPWGIASVLFYAWVFWKQHLYASAGLQIFYFLPCCVYGWWVWAKCGPLHNDDLPIAALSFTARLGWLAASVAFSLLVGLPIAHYTQDPLPYTDSFVTGFSIVAQYLQAKKVFENWWLWFAIDVVYALYIFPSQKLWLSTLLYLLFLAMAVQGMLIWRPLIGKHIIGGGTKTEDAVPGQEAQP